MAKLVIITRDYIPIHNGLSDHTKLLVEMLLPRFDSVHIICEAIDGDRETRNSGDDGVSITEFTGMRDLFRKLSEVMKGERPDVVLFQYVPHMWGRAGVAPKAALVPLWLRVKYRVRVVTFLHELYYDWNRDLKQVVLSVIHRIQLLSIGMFSHSLIVTNQRRYSKLRWLWGKKLSRIPAGNVSGRKPDNLRTSIYPWPYIAWFGTLGDDQQLEQLVYAFCEIGKRYLELRLVLVGAFDPASPRIQALLRFAKLRGAAGRIVFRGYVDDEELSDTLSGSLVNTVLYASGPSGRRSVVAACLRSGSALVAVDGKERDPEFQHDVNVILVKPGNAGAMAAAFRKVYENKSYREQLERESRLLYKDYFADEVVAERLTRVVANARTSSSKHDLNYTRGS